MEYHESKIWSLAIRVIRSSGHYGLIRENGMIAESERNLME